MNALAIAYFGVTLGRVLLTSLNFSDFSKLVTNR